jgi:large conductance mechanosensitive channel
MINEFKAFINQGNVFQTAVGLILALAFAPIVTSLVDDIIMQVVARVFSAPDFSTLSIGLGGSGDPEPALYYGRFINFIISFLIIAFVLFLLVKAYNRAFPPKDEEAGHTEIELLTEIRDSLSRR